MKLILQSIILAVFITEMAILFKYISIIIIIIHILIFVFQKTLNKFFVVDKKTWVCNL